jgi:ketosteroid isomerase-like protein
MSKETVEVVRRALGPLSEDAADADVRTASVQGLAAEVEFEEDPRFPEARTYRGRDDVLRYFTDFVSQFESFKITVDDLVACTADDVLACLHIHGRGKGSSAEFDVSAGWVYTVREGEVVRIKAYLDRAEALEAMGLSE